jgi:pimeloyl-ACP methyl ester carboxylesterase
MARLDVNGTTLEYVEKGTGEPVVLVHGSASDYRTWQAQLDEFGRRYETLAYSRRHHWHNEPIPDGADYSMEQHVDDLHAFLQSLNKAPVHLVGHSYGAFLCLLLAIREPGLARTLVLAEPPVITLFVSNVPKPSEILTLLLSRPRTAVSIMKLGATGMSPATAAAKRGDMEAAMRIFGKAVLGPEFYSRLSPSRLEQVRANAIKAEFLGSGFVRLDNEKLREMPIPALLVTGRSSPRVLHRLVDRLEELLPHTERVEIGGASHIMHEDNASDYNKAVLSFLSMHQAV